MNIPVSQLVKLALPMEYTATFEWPQADCPCLGGLLLFPMFYVTHGGGH